MMNISRFFSFALFLLFFAFLAPHIADAKVTPPTGGKGGKECPGVVTTYKNNKSKAISCYRSPARQAALRAALIKAGKKGQAGKVSNHTKGCACDYTTRALKNRTGCPWMNKKGHSGNHCSHTGR